MEIDLSGKTSIVTGAGEHTEGRATRARRRPLDRHRLQRAGRGRTPLRHSRQQCRRVWSAGLL
jgi:hypothetical protein